MGKRFRNLLVTLLAVFSFIVLISSSQATAKAATNYGTNDLLSGISIKDKNHGTASEVNLTIDWDATGKDLQAGDTWTIDLPTTLKVKSPGENIELIDNDGNVIGNAVLNADNTITVTFNENVENKQDFTGSINIASGIGVGKDAVVGKNDVQIGDKHANMTVTTSDSDFSKKGVIGTDENGNAIVTWTILANRNSQEFKNLTISDRIDSTTSGQTYVPGTVNVYEAYWTDKTGYYKKKGPISGYQLNEATNGFEISNLPKDNQFYAVTFQTRINDPENMAGFKFKNHADFTWSDGGSGNGSNNNQGSADGSVTSNTNSGSGNGNEILGSVTLTKQSADNDATLLAGAVYDLYKVGSDEPIKTGLTTDENGQLTVTDLAKGNYYFKEVTAPDGYQVNGNEVPFTITGSTSTTVNVTAKDEPAGSEEGSIVIMKLDAETGYRLSGAEFEVKDSAGNVVGKITTDSLGIGHLYNLPIGDYTLVETKAPAGYLITQKEINFSITKDNLTPAMISVENENETGFDDTYSVDLQKFDRADMTTGVPGAEYSLYKEDGTFITKAVTGKDGILTIDGLEPGKYYFLETKAPDGFDLNPEKIPFEIIDDGDKIGVGTLETSDPRTKGEGGGNEGNTTDPDTDENDDNEGEGEGNTTDPDTDENEDNEGGLIVNPENPGSGNNGGSTTGQNTASGNNNSNKLPQTGDQINLFVSVLGLIVLLGTVIFKRRQA
ncbi:SpaA isopeptide-forming pilin-related protein [Companilactobacillus sp. FL22-1]|uniref:SpaA isopeptide-forming pilin-related protein n=1 Tax=Companilactobacillus sp. FL22-1 TaxID=3373892 RepID=UPI003754397A